MLPDFELIQHHFPTNEDITIIPVADVHLGSAGQMEKEFLEFLSWVEKTPNVYLMIVGDMLNNGTKNSVSTIYREKYFPSEAKRMMAKMLTPVKDRILCGVCGNHERRSIKETDDDPLYDIFCKLDREEFYRENACFVKIQIGDINGDGKTNPTYTIVVTHGSGGGLLTGSTVNKAERFGYVIDGMDCLILGHSHKPFTTQPAKIKIDPFNNRVSMKPFKVICATSWLEFGGYAMAGMMLPSSHCLNKLTLCGSKKEMSVTM